MSTVKTTVDPGVCQMTAIIITTCEDGRNATVEIESPCDKVQKFARRIALIDVFDELGPDLDTAIYQAFNECMYGGCTSCIVPAAASKSAQISAGLALSRDASIQFEKQEDAG